MYFFRRSISRAVTFTLDDRGFAVWADGWKIPAGTYAVEIDASVADIRLRGTMDVDGVELSAPVWQSGSWYETFKGQPRDEDFVSAYGGPIQPEPVIEPGRFTMEMSLMEMKDKFPMMMQMFKATEQQIAQGFGGKADYDNPTFKMLVMSGADAPLRSFYWHSRYPGTR